MARPIDADALMETIRAREYPLTDDPLSTYYGLSTDGIQQAVDEQPTISPDEAAGVVHCHECDLWNRWDSAGRESLGNLTCSCAHWTVEDGAVIHTKPDDFCSYGERMVSEDA